MLLLRKRLGNCVCSINEAAEYYVCRDCCTAQAWMNAKETVNCGAWHHRSRAVSVPLFTEKTYISAFGYTAGKGGAFIKTLR